MKTNPEPELNSFTCSELAREKKERDLEMQEFKWGCFAFLLSIPTGALAAYAAVLLTDASGAGMLWTFGITAGLCALYCLTRMHSYIPLYPNIHYPEK